MVTTDDHLTELDLGICERRGLNNVVDRVVIVFVVLDERVEGHFAVSGRGFVLSLVPDAQLIKAQYQIKVAGWLSEGCQQHPERFVRTSIAAASTQHITLCLHVQAYMILG